MSADEPGSFKDLKARFETSSNGSTSINHYHSESSVAKTKRLFEKTKNPINASNRFKPALKPKPKYLSQPKIDPQPPPLPPPIPPHNFNNHNHIISPHFRSKFNISENCFTNSNGAFCPSLSSTTLSELSLDDD